jgi:NADH dehydrogenase
LSINSEESFIETEIGNLQYDYLVIATGATNNFFGNDVIQENSLPMKSLRDSLNLRSKILYNFEKALNTSDLERRKELMNVVIVGAGPTGVELAGAIAELKNKVLPSDFPDLDFREMQINLVEAAPRVLSSMSEKSSEKAYKYLTKMGVNVWTDTFVESYSDNVVKTGKEDFRSDTLIWSAGVKGNHPSGLEKIESTGSSRIVTDQYCKVKFSDTMFAVGDVSYCTSEKYPDGLPMLGSVAMQQGKYLATYFNNLANKKESKPFVYLDKGTMATIGRNKAVVEIGTMFFQGVFAWITWMLVHLMLLVGFRNRVVVLVNWAWNYVKFNNSLRLIIRPFSKSNE